MSLAPTKIAPQRPVKGIGINLAIVVFNLTLIGVMWIAVLGITRVDLRETINTANDRNDNLAIALEQYTQRTIESADAVIHYMIREYVRNSRQIDLDQFVADYTIDNKAFAGIVLADEHGNLATTAYMGKPAKPVNVADREHFRVHLAGDTQQLFVGKPVIGRVTGKAVVPLTRRINKPDGSFGGVAMVLIEHTRFTDVLHDAKMRQLDIISVIGLDGITRARLRGTTPSTGEDISKSPLFAEQAQRPNGRYSAKGQIDGVKRLFSYRTLPDYRLIATVGVAEAEVLAGFNQRKLNYFWAAGITSVLITGFSLLLILMLRNQRLAAAMIASSQARFMATFNQAAVGITHTDIHGRLIEVNQKFCDIVGYSREELLGRPFSDITHPDDLAENLAVRRKITSPGNGKNVSPLLEKRYIRKDGSIVWCLLNISAVRDAAGDIDYLAAVTQDISQRKAAEQALKALEQEQRLLAEQAEAERARLAEAQAVAKIGSWETKLPELTVTWSAETYRIFEVDAERFQPTHAAFLEFIHPDDRAKVDAAFLASLADQSSHSIEHRIVLRDGRIKTVDERWHTFLDDQGQPVRVAGTCQDITDKKKAEQDRAQLAAIVESSNDAIVSRSLDGAILSWNQAAERMFGWTAAEAIGRPPQIMTPPDHVGKFSHLIERVKRGEITEPFEAIRVRKNGARFDAQVSLSAVKDNSGKVIAIATIVRDITDRKLAEQTQAQLAAIVESSNDAIISRDLNRVILSWNPAAERLFGWTATEALGQSVRIITPPERAGELEPVVQRMLKGETVAPAEALRVRKDGTRFEAQVSFSLIRDSNGKITAIATIIRDITERKRAEKAQNQLAAIVESSNDAIISSLPDDKKIISWNTAAERMFGWSANEAIGQSVRIITPPEHIGRLDPLIRRTKRGETVAPVEVWRQRKDGSRFEAQISFSDVRDQDGNITAIATIVRDITERREKEAIAQKEKLFSDAMIESMPGIVYFYTEQGQFLRWNENFLRVSGYSPEEIKQMHPLDFFGGNEKHLLERKIKEVFEHGESAVEASFLLKNGRAIPYFFTGKRVIYDGKPCLVGMGVDIHERKRAEAALRDYAAQMRHLSWRLSEVEERERRNIHRELHDQVGANLAALKLDLGLINNMLLASDTHKTICDRLKKTQQLTGETISRIRDVMADLRPPALDDYGLLAALRNYAQPYSTRLGIPVMVDGEDIQPRLAIAVETALFRIAQEALSNIAKHAQAHHVGITVTATDDGVKLVIADDGLGFDAGHADPHQAAWGLRTMRERAQAINASFRLESSPGKGTRVIVELPSKLA